MRSGFANQTFMQLRLANLCFRTTPTPLVEHHTLGYAIIIRPYNCHSCNWTKHPLFSRKVWLQSSERVFLHERAGASANVAKQQDSSSTHLLEISTGENPAIENTTMGVAGACIFVLPGGPSLGGHLLWRHKRAAEIPRNILLAKSNGLQGFWP